MPAWLMYLRAIDTTSRRLAEVRWSRDSLASFLSSTTISATVSASLPASR